MSREFQEHPGDEESTAPDQLCFASRALVKSPCQDACPVSLNCHGYVALVEEGKFEDAYRLIRQRLPFPMTLGRVCNAPCEGKCRRAQMDIAVAVRDLKRFVADYAYNRGLEYTPKTKSRREERVAIVGAGPAGLSAAYDLAREGFQVTVFEALPVAGGMLAVGCPEYRLPKMLLESEIENVTRLGVEIRLGHRITDIRSLFGQGYKSIFLAVGAHHGRTLLVPGADLNDVLTATLFLREVNLKRKVNLGKRVIVVGGGDVAFDCARTAIRLGADVHITCLESREKMPAARDEIAAGEEEGALIHPSRAVTRILAEDGRLTGVECLNLRWMEFDKEGRLHVDAVAGSEHILPADTVVFAVGQVPDLSFTDDVNGLEVSNRGTICVDPDTLATAITGIFAGGDVVLTTGSIVKAIAQGERAAISITSYLNGEKLSAEAKRQDDEVIAFSTVVPSQERLVQKKPRTPVQLTPVALRRTSFDEVTATYSAAKAVAEASRCLRCDLVRPAEDVRAAYGEIFDVRRSLEEQFEVIKRLHLPQPASQLRRLLLHSLGIHKRRKARAENVMMLSCGSFGMVPQLISSMKLLDRLGVDYTYSTEEVCCGLGQLEFGTGSDKDWRSAERGVAELVEWNLARARELGARRLVCFCQWCAYITMKYGRKGDIEVVYYPDVILERIDALESLRPTLLPTKVGYFEGCHLRNVAFAPKTEINWKRYRQLLEIIKGLTIVDLPSWKCCVNYYKEIVAEAQRENLACIVTPCTACWTWLEREGSKRGMEVKMLQDILVEVLGEKPFRGLV